MLVAPVTFQLRFADSPAAILAGSALKETTDGCEAGASEQPAKSNTTSVMKGIRFFIFYLLK
jgi:uncharacterized membrane protein YadS